MFCSPSDNDEQAVKRGYLANEYDFQGMKNIMSINFGAVIEGKTKDTSGSRTFQHKSWHLCLLL